MRKKDDILTRLADTDRDLLVLEVLVDIRDVLLWILKEMREANLSREKIWYDNQKHTGTSL